MREFLVLLIFTPILTQDISPLVDIKTLSELPLEKLLQVKKSFSDNVEESANSTRKSDNPEEPQALPLKIFHGDSKPYKRGGYHSYEYEDTYYKKGMLIKNFCCKLFNNIYNQYKIVKMTCKHTLILIIFRKEKHSEHFPNICNNTSISGFWGIFGMSFITSY